MACSIIDVRRQCGPEKVDKQEKACSCLTPNLKGPAPAMFEATPPVGFRARFSDIRSNVGRTSAELVEKRRLGVHS